MNLRRQFVKKLAVTVLAAVTMFGANPFNAVALERVVDVESAQTYLREEAAPNHLVTSHFIERIVTFSGSVPQSITYSTVINGQLFTGTLSLVPGSVSGDFMRAVGIFRGNVFSTNIFSHEDIK